MNSLTPILDALLAHAETAGAAANLTDVAVGLPLPRGRCVRIYWEGETTPAKFAADRSLNSKLKSQRIKITGFWPIADAAEAPARIRIEEMFAFVDALRTAILGDSTLGGAQTDLEMESATIDMAAIGGTLFAIADAAVVTDMFEYELAP